MAEIKKYLDTTALGTLVDQIKAEDAKVLQSAKDYSDSKDKLFESAGASNTALTNAKAYTDEKVDALANGAVKANTDAIAKLNGDATTEGSVAKAVADAKALIDADVDAVEVIANKNKDDIAAINDGTNGILAQAAADATTKANAVQANVDELAGYVGDIPEGYTEETVIAYINKKAEETLASATGGSSESAASVLAALNTYKSENDPKVAKNTEDIAALQTSVGAAQAAADAAQGYAEGVAGDLADEVAAREAADNAQVARIESLEGQIVGLSGAMHFEGVKDALPEDVSDYENGDVIIVGNKEYVFNGTAFVEFGDASVNAEAITTLTGRVDGIEDRVEVLEGEMDGVQAAVATKVEQSVYDAKVAELEGADSDLSGRLDVLEAKTGTGEGSIAEDIATAKSEAVSEATEAAAADATTKANQALTDAKAYTDTEVGKDRARLDALEADTHTHSNKALLDTYTQTEANLADAVAKKHEHANKAVLDGIDANKVAAWDAAEQNAKDFATGLNNTLTATVNGIDGRLTTVEGAVATKAEADDLETLEGTVATNTANITALQSSVNSWTAITSDEVNALFA